MHMNFTIRNAYYSEKLNPKGFPTTWQNSILYVLHLFQRPVLKKNVKTMRPVISGNKQIRLAEWCFGTASWNFSSGRIASLFYYLILEYVDTHKIELLVKLSIIFKLLHEWKRIQIQVESVTVHRNLEHHLQEFAVYNIVIGAVSFA